MLNIFLVIMASFVTCYRLIKCVPAMFCKLIYILMVLEYALQNTLGLYLCEHLIFMQVQWVYCLVYVIDMESLIILYRNRPSNMSPPSLPEVFDF